MEVSRICLGCMGFGDAERWTHKWVLDEENSRPIIQRALELCIIFFDTANVYSLGASEEIVGHALRDFAQRDEIVLAALQRGHLSSCRSRMPQDGLRGLSTRAGGGGAGGGGRRRRDGRSLEGGEGVSAW